MIEQEIADALEAHGRGVHGRAGEERYATFFVAALVGRTRTGAPLSRNPDINGDGVMSMLEAHYYAFSESDSKDVPRSTSEQFLELAQPWFSRWLPATGFRHDNPYVQIAKWIGDRLGLAKATAAELVARRRTMSADTRATENAQDRLSAEEANARNELRRVFERRWPQVLAPHRQSWNKILTAPSEVLASIVAQPGYAAFVELQKRLAATEIDLLAKERALAQVEKLQRARHLATLYEHVMQHAGKSDVQMLAVLRACESWTLPP